jgi:hypothetical protein
MGNKIQLNRNQRRVLNLIPSGMDRPILVTEISNILGLDKRSVASVINQLTRLGVPIGSLRQADRNGVFIPINEEERTAGLTPIRSQTADMAKRIELVEHASLSGWRNLLEASD